MASSSSSSSSVPEKTHDPLNSEPPLKWDKDTRTPLLPLPPPPPPHFSPLDTTAIWTTPDPRRYFSHSPSPPSSPPQHCQNYSPRQDSLPESIDCSAKLSSFIQPDSSWWSSFTSPRPFFRWDSESAARRMSTSYSRNYHHHQGPEGSNLYRGRDEKKIRRQSELDPRRHWSHQGGSEGSPYRERGTENHEKRTEEEETDVAGVKRSSKILIKIPCKKIKSAEEKPVEKKPKEKKAVDKVDEKEEAEINDEGDEKTKEAGEIREDDGKTEEGDTREEDAKIGEERQTKDYGDEVEEGEKNPRVEEEVRVWNLRPRKPMSKGNEGPSSTKNANDKLEENKRNGGGGGEKKEQPKVKLSLNVPLTKKEIEEDFFAWSGAKPPRRPHKRPKNVQKLLDSLFPGCNLKGICVDSYKS